MYNVEASPSVHWSQTSINAIIPQGGRKNVTIYLNALKPLGNIYLEPVPNIKPYIIISPESFPNVKSGDTIPINLNIHADSSAPLGLFSGVIHVRQSGVKNQRKVLARPLPINVLIREEEGVNDVDADGNGVWDYIDQYINNKYPGREYIQLRSAARQYALALQGALLNADNKDLSLEYAIKSDRATECMFCVRPDDAGDILADLEAAILNSKTRARAFLMFSEQCAGQVFRSVPISQRCSSCDAD